MGIREIHLAYPGAPGIISIDYTTSHGTRPGLVEMVIHPDLTNLAPVGDVMMTDGVSRMTIANCRVVNTKGDFGIQGYTVTVWLEDGRWPWRYGNISGHYNQPIPRVFDTPRVPNYGEVAVNPVIAQLAGQSDQFTPPLQQWSKKSARQLCELLLKAMGVRNFDINAVPNDEYPEVFWDIATASHELDSLCDLFGCRVCFNHETMSVKIVRLGKGEQLPPANGDELQREGFGVDPPEVPRRIAVYGAPKVHQLRFSLEAVLPDFDGQYKPIDEVSYKPKNGWQYISPECFGLDSSTAYNVGQLPGTRTPREAYNLAASSLWRTYRIKETIPFHGTDVLRIPATSNYATDNVDRLHIVLLDYLAEATYDDIGQRSMMPPKIIGRAHRYDKLAFNDTTTGQTCKVTFDIDPVHRIVILHTPLLLHEKRAPNADTYLYYPADIYLEASCHVLDMLTHHPVRYRKAFSPPVDGESQSSRPDELGIVREEIRFFHRINYSGSNAVLSTTTNQPECDEKADFFFQGEMARFQITTPQDRLYNGIKRGVLDGAIQQISYSVSMGGATTRISRNNEHSVFIPPYAMRRQWEAGSAENLFRGAKKADDIRRRIRGDDPFSA